jgi:hypothetical protein
MTSATVFTETCQPPAHRSKVILGDPYVRPDAVKKRTIRSSNFARLTSRLVGPAGRRRHL